MHTYRNLTNLNKKLGWDLKSLASGYRINNAADDAANLCISENMRTKMRILEKSKENQELQQLELQVKENALSSINSMVNRMTELALQSSDGTLGETERQQLQEEFNQLREAIDAVSEGTSFNGKNVLQKEYGQYKVNATLKNKGTVDITNVSVSGGYLKMENTAKFSIELDKENTVKITNENGVRFEAYDKNGKKLNAAEKTGKTDVLFSAFTENKTVYFKAVDMPNTDRESKKWTGMTIAVSVDNPKEQSTVSSQKDSKAFFGAAGSQSLLVQDIGTFNSSGLGLNKMDISTQNGALKALDGLKEAVEKVIAERAEVGAKMNAIDHNIQTIDEQIANLTEYESRIRDADMALIMMDYTKHSIMIQASQAMLSHSMKNPQMILKLLL